jgi:hypothetical protein
MKHKLILSIIFIFLVNWTNAQTQNYYDPEPINICPFCPHKYFIFSPLRSFYKTEEEYQKKLKENEYYQKENDRFDKEYPDCENQRNKCIEKYQKEVLEWRKRNPNWKKTASNKEEINVNEIQSKNLEVKIGETYLITSQSLNLRSEANKTSTIISTLKLGNEVKLLNAENSIWWYVSDGSNEGYIYSQYLKLDPNSGWNKKHYESGETPECENVDPRYDYKLDNYLKVNVGSNSDVVIKLMKKQYEGDICTRIVFIRRNETYYLKNIPEGNYYLKIAYGKDWRQKIVDQKCYGKFMKDAIYEIGDERLDYNLIHKPDSYQVPSFELSLDVIVTRGTKPTFKSNDISEAEFNK